MEFRILSAGKYGTVVGLLALAGACGDAVDLEGTEDGTPEAKPTGPTTNEAGEVFANLATVGETAPYAPGVEPDQLGYPTDDCEGFIIDEGSWTLNPGENVNYCVRVPIPEEFQGRDLVLTGWAWNLDITHHYFMEYSPRAHPDEAAGLVPCRADGSQGTFSLLGSANAENSKITFGAGEGSGYVLGDGTRGQLLTAGGHFRTSHHVVNPTTEPMEIGGKFKVCVKDAEEVPYPGTLFSCTTTAINVPAGEMGDTTATCIAPYDLDIYILSSHGHNHLTRFTVQEYRDGQTQDPIIYESDDWDSPTIVNLAEPIHLKEGDGLTYTCTYEGPAKFSDTTESPDAEHCALFTAYSYPEGREYEIPGSLNGVSFTPNAKTKATASFPGSPI